MLDLNIIAVQSKCLHINWTLLSLVDALLYDPPVKL